MSNDINQAAPEQVSPEQVVEDQAVALQVSSEEAAPEETATDQAASEAVVPDESAPEQAAKYKNRELYILNINKLTPDPNQPRKHFDDDDLVELGNSIKKHGVLQPILFRQEDDGKLIIVSGERRYKASLLVNEKKIPAIYTTGKIAEIALIENLLRVDLTPLEEAEAMKKLQIEAKYKNKDLAAAIGKAESSISEILSLNNLPTKIKEKVRTNPKFSRRQLITIAKIKDEKDQMKRFNAVKKMIESDATPKEKQKDVEDNRSKPITTVKRMIQGLETQLQTFDLTSLKEEELVDIRQKLQKLVEDISQKLS